MVRKTFESAYETYAVVDQFRQGGVGTVYKVTDGASELLVMPFYPETLRDFIERSTTTGPQRLEVFFEILNGVEAAHLSKVVHRDLKPENILIDPGKPLVVADFGAAHFHEEVLHTEIQTGPGTRLANFQYCAPEQRSRNSSVDRRSDIFALGLILNELYTGQVMHGANPARIADHSPEFSYLDEIVDLMCQQSPERRPNSIDNVKKELIARRVTNVSRQKIVELNSQVIQVEEVDDPMALAPPML